MDDPVTVDMSETFQNLSKESPIFLRIVMKSSANKITKGLLLTELHLDVQDGPSRSCERARRGSFSNQGRARTSTCSARSIFWHSVRWREKLWVSSIRTRIRPEDHGRLVVVIRTSIGAEFNFIPI